MRVLSTDRLGELVTWHGTGCVIAGNRGESVLPSIECLLPRLDISMQQR